MSLYQFILASLIGYLLGSIPFAVIISSLCGVNIFKVGSGNSGATNVTRSVGKKAGKICFFLDAFKGFLGTGWPMFLPIIFRGIDFSNPQYMAITGLIACLIGHSFSVFIKFRGGKGVSVAIGGLIALIWKSIIVGLIVWLGIFLIYKYVSLASICFAICLPIATGFFYGIGTLPFWISVVICIFIICMHFSNIKRLINKTEHKFKKQNSK